MLVTRSTDTTDHPVPNSTATRTEAPLLAKAWDDAAATGKGQIQGKQQVESAWDFLDGQFGDQKRFRHLTFEENRHEIVSEAA
jgi:hypothetical protein